MTTCSRPEPAALLGRSLVPLLDELRSWGQQYGRRYAAMVEVAEGQ
ncbi:hypothetical protein [Cryptosporangium minutisporangium]